MKTFGITGWKNSGKTGLTVRLVSEFTKRGLRVATIKHAHHDFDIDHEGRDSDRHRKAGADQVLVASGMRWAMIRELGGDTAPSLSILLSKLEPCDLVLIEGYKHEPIPKLECYRQGCSQPARCLDDDSICLLASDIALPDAPCAQYMLDDTQGIANAIAAQVALQC